MLKEQEAQFRFFPGAHIDVHRAHDGHLVETAVFSGEQYHKTLISVTSQIGCPAKCSFCFLGDYNFSRNVNMKEYLQQVQTVLENKYGIPWFDPKKEVKVCFTRAGEPLMNSNTIDGVAAIAENFSPSFQLSSIMPNTKSARTLLQYLMGYIKGYKESFQINVSMHTTDEEKRKQMIGYDVLMSFKEIAEFGEEWNKVTGKRKVNLSFVLMDDNEVDIRKMKDMFNPEFFAIRFALYLPSSAETAEKHPLSIIERMEGEVKIAKALGYECIESVAKDVEMKWDTRPGSGLKMLRR